MSGPVTLQLDVWSGELHQDHVRRVTTEHWDIAQSVIRKEVEDGNLVNILIEPKSFIPNKLQ